MKKKQLFEAEFVQLGRSKVCKKFYYNTKTQLHKEIQKHLATRNWDMLFMSTSKDGQTDLYEISSGWRQVGSVIIKEVKEVTPVK